MLDAFIIEEIKRREKERLKREGERPRLEIPLPRDDRDDDERKDDEEDRKRAPPKRGVVVVIENS